MANRFVADMSNHDYHSGGGISKTTLDMAHADPYRPEWSRKCPQDEDKIKTFDFGDAMHAICLEPERLKSEFVVMPPFNLRTNDGTAESKAKIAAAYDKAMDEYQGLIGDKWPHEQALMTAEAMLIGTLTGLYNVLAEQVAS